jgi:hypothetical protein
MCLSLSAVWVVVLLFYFYSHSIFIWVVVLFGTSCCDVPVLFIPMFLQSSFFFCRFICLLVCVWLCCMSGCNFFFLSILIMFLVFDIFLQVGPVFNTCCAYPELFLL